MTAGKIPLLHTTMAGLLLAALTWAPAAMARKNRNPDTSQAVDSGTFVVVVKSQRVATETFHIAQGTAFSTASSEFKGEIGEKVLQKAELQITPAGELHHYEWRELSPRKEQITVEPSEQNLVEHIVPEPPERPVTQGYLLPLTTMVLDDYFFSQREVLAWRYLAQSCGGDLKQCRPGVLQLGVLVPRRRLPLVVTIENAGPEKVKLNGSEQDLNRLNLKIPDEADWVLYLDVNFKLVRILIPAEDTEIVRE
jgi:hypothetical protein